MAFSARLPLAVDRYGACVRTVIIRGIDLTGVTMRAQVRLLPDTPGAPLIDLNTVEAANAQGLYLASAVADETYGFISTVQIRINETTLEALPYSGELGDQSVFAWDWQITLSGDKRRVAFGDFIVLPGVTGANAAPTGRTASYGSRARGSVWSSSTLNFGDEITVISIDGADALAPLVAETTANRDATANYANRAALSSATAEAVAGPTYASVAAGEAATVTDQSFAVDNGDGTVTVYLRTAGGSTAQRTLATTDALAGTGGGELLGILDGGKAQDALSAGRAVATVADMIALSPVAGAIYRTAGYYAAGDKGSATYKIEAGPGTAGPGDHVCANGNIARLQNDGVNAVYQFGAKGDGEADDTDAVADAIASEIYGAGVSRINWGEDADAVFLLSSALTVDLKKILFIGAGTPKRADGVIVNTDGDSNHFTPIFRLQGVTGRLQGKWRTDGNRDGQTYPDTDSTPGRGTIPMRHNGDIEICPGSDNVTPSSDLIIDYGGGANAYMNALVLWQVNDAIVRADLFADCTWNGIAGAGCRRITINDGDFVQCGYSTDFPISQKLGDRTGIQFRELPKGWTAASEGLPTITKAAGDINERILIQGSRGIRCCVESFYMRACFASAMVNCYSQDCGYGATDAVMTYFPTHFWAEGGEVSMPGCVAVQTVDNLAAGDRRPDGFRNAPLDGDATAFYPAVGSRIVVSPGCRATSLYDAAGDPQPLLNRGFYVGSKSLFPDAVVDGCSDYAATIWNVFSYGDEPIPHDVSFDGLDAKNCNLVLTTQTSAISVARYGSATAGNVQNISATRVSTDQASALSINTNLSGYSKVNVSHGIGTVFSRYYETAEISLTAGKTQVTHGLGGLPRAVTTLIRNKTTEYAIPAGDEVHNICPPNVTVDAGTSQLTIMVGTGDIVIGNRATGSEGQPVSITRGYWKLVVRALA